MGGTFKGTGETNVGEMHVSPLEGTGEKKLHRLLLELMADPSIAGVHQIPQD